MRRRDFLTILGVAAAWPRLLRAQQAGKIPRIGLLVSGSLEKADVRFPFDIVRKAFAELGYVEGQNIVFEQRGRTGRSKSSQLLLPNSWDSRSMSSLPWLRPPAEPRSVQLRPSRSSSAQWATPCRMDWWRAFRIPAVI